MSEYRDFHKNQFNLIIHVIAVPIFIVALIAAIWFLVSGEFMHALAALLAAVFSMAAQGIGHKREATPPLPFTGPLNAIGRIIIEQFYSFPKFAVSGDLIAAWRRKER